VRIFISSNPLNKRTDKTPIYPLHTHLPPTIAWQRSFDIHKSNTSEFIEHLYFLTMEENGFSYFYPDNDAGTNLCRFEWHYHFRGELYFLRLGLCFKVKKSEIIDVVYSVQPHEKYKDISKEVEDPQITDEEYKDIESFISKKIETAKERTRKNREKVFNCLYYFESQKPVKEPIYLDNKLMLLPSYRLNEKLITAMIVPTLGYSYIDSKRFGDEKANLFLAIYSFSIGYAELFHNGRLPFVSELDYQDAELHVKKLESFYPDGESSQFGNLHNIGEVEITLINWFYTALDKLENDNRRKALNILFTYYASIESQRSNRTIALVGFVACMNSVTKLIEKEFFSENGDRKTIVHYLSKILGIEKESSQFKALEKWSKNVYNDHRSSFVHGANHRFEEYSQNMDGKNFAGLPPALPSTTKPVSKQYEYINDFNIAAKVAKLMLIDIFEIFSGVTFDKKEMFTDINFSLESIPEGYIGMINDGWIKLT
jgi:hypothetical protein